jgi:acetone carboxylase, beta subunit
MARSSLIAIDAGGTMTDAFLVDESGRFAIGKALTRRQDEAVSYVESVDDAAQSMATDGRCFHRGTLLSIYAGTGMLNTLLTRAGKKVGLLVTRGFEHISVMERGLTWLGQSVDEVLHQVEKEHTEPLVDPRHVRGVTERIASGSYYFTMEPGTVVIPINQDETRAAVNDLLDDGVEMLGICFLYSYLNPEHERIAGAIAREEIEARGANVQVLLSCDVIPVIKENQRVKSLILQGYAAESTRAQLLRVEDAARGQGYDGNLLTVTSYGSVVDVRYPRLYETIISGPVGGLVGARALSEIIGCSKVVACDLGGTSFDVGLIIDNSIDINREPDFDRHRLALPMVNLDSIGAGAGTLVHVDPQFKRITLGPESAGSEVGVCLDYPDITVSDINVALGYLNPDYFLGGKVRLDRARALEALEERLAAPLGLDLYDACDGVHELLHSQMKDLLYSMLLSRGYVPADYTLLVYGGGGPLHMWGITEDVDFNAVATVPWAAAFSAYGNACADYSHRYHAGVSVHIPPGWDTLVFEDIAARFNGLWAELEDKARAEFDTAGIAREHVRFRHGFYGRYMGALESTEVSLPFGRIDDADSLHRLTASFDSQYERIYTKGAKSPEAGYFINELVVEGVADKVKPAVPAFELGAPDPDRRWHKGTRALYFKKRWREFQVWEMEGLHAGVHLDGPAVVEDPMTTLVVPPGKTAILDEHRIIWLRSAADR